jgi:hypothetical protein
MKDPDVELTPEPAARLPWILGFIVGVLLLLVADMVLH